MNCDPSVVHPVANRYTDCAIPAPSYIFNVNLNIFSLISGGDETESTVPASDVRWVGSIR
jgi:hypothetical protein